MMKTHRTSKIRSLGGVSTLAALLVAGLGLSAPSFAQEQEQRKDETARQDVIIKRIGKDGKGETVDGKRLAELMAKCQPETKGESNVTPGEGENKFRTRVIICGGAEHTNNPKRREALAKALDKARAALSENETLSEKGRAQAAEALEREVARLRSQGR